MKRLYSLYFAGFVLALAGSVLLITSPVTVYACTGSAKCQYGESVTVPLGATSCSCVDNDGCTWVINGQTYTQKCAKKGTEAGDEPEQGPIN